MKILRIQKVGIAISYADRWFPTTSQHHSAKNKIDISGGTKDAASAKAVAGATLTFYQNEVPVLIKSSAKGGGCRIKSLPNGTYTLTVSRLGYTAQTLTVHISNTKLTTINVALEKVL